MTLMSKISKWFTDDTITPEAVPVDAMLDAYLAGEEVDGCKLVIKYEHTYGYGDTPEQAKDDAASLRDIETEISDANERIKWLSEELERTRQMNAEEVGSMREVSAALQKVNADRFNEIRSLSSGLKMANDRLVEIQAEKIRVIEAFAALSKKFVRIDPDAHVTIKTVLKWVGQDDFDTLCHVNKIKPFKSPHHGPVITRKQADTLKAQVFLWDRSKALPSDENWIDAMLERVQ